MKKKIVAMGLVLAMAVTATACGSSSSSTATTTAAAAAAETQAAAAAAKPAAGAKELSLFAGSISSNTPTGNGLEAMAAYINENSNGELNAVTYYDTALGDASSMVEGLKMGTIDIGISGTAYFSSLMPEIEVFQLPFLFSDLETARKATAGPAADEINTMMNDLGLVGLSFWENGFRELSNNVRNVKEPADLDGIKMRTLGSKIQIATWSAFGAMTTQIDASELYTSLQQGTIDAQDNPLHEIVSRKLYEVQPYVTLTDATYTPFYMAMSKITWDSLTEDQQKVIVEAAAVGRQAQFDATDAAQATAKQTLLDNGVTIEENPDKAAFQEIAMPLWSTFTDQSDKCAELLKMVQDNM